LTKANDFFNDAKEFLTNEISCEQILGADVSRLQQSFLFTPFLPIFIKIEIVKNGISPLT